MKGQTEDSRKNDWSRADWSSLLRGRKSAWDRFVDRHSAIIFAAVRRRLNLAGRGDDCDDVVQDVFVKLFARDRAVLRAFDPTKAALSTYLTVVANSVALDHLRRHKAKHEDLEAAPPELLSQDPVEPQWLTIEEGLLSARQTLILELLYRHDLTPQEVGEKLSIDAQTVRSTHHKALIKLREHFKKRGEEG